MSAAGSRSPASDQAQAAARRVVEQSYGRLVGFLASISGDLAAAEDALSDALLAALRTWPDRGVPDRPESWLLTVARRSLIDAARRRTTAERALPELARRSDDLALDDDDAESLPDRRLELLFTCAHPAIDRGMHGPLMLQAVLGLDAARIASAYLVSPATMGQRLVRVKSRIREARIPFALPPATELAGRVGSVLDAIYVAYGTGWDAAADQNRPGSGDRLGGLVPEAITLTMILADLLPAEAEVHGLLAMMLHSAARADARRGADGAFVPLDEQDVSRWSRSGIGRAEEHLTTALALGRVGPYQLLGAIQSVHNRRALTGRTDWAAIAELHDGLVGMTPTVGALVARAKARSHTDGPTAGLTLLDAIGAERVVTYQPYWVVRAFCLRESGNRIGARDAASRAIGLTSEPAVRHHLYRTYLV